MVIPDSPTPLIAVAVVEASLSCAACAASLPWVRMTWLPAVNLTGLEIVKRESGQSSTTAPEPVSRRWMS